MINKNKKLTDLEKAFLKTAKIGWVNDIRRMAEKGVNINVQDETGRTALIWAALSNHIEAVQILVDLGADPNIRDKERLNAYKAATIYTPDSPSSKYISYIIEKAIKIKGLEKELEISEDKNKFIMDALSKKVYGN